MNWINTLEKRPNTTSAYVVKIIKDKEHNLFSFIYVAYFDVETEAWYKYNPFNENRIEDEIKDNVFEWLDNCSVLI
jgi:hypothetical protein